MNKKFRTALALAIFVSLVGGCAIGGGSTLVKPTIGQELIDAKRAMETGSITEEEYLRLKDRLLHSR